MKYPPLKIAIPVVSVLALLLMVLWMSGLFSQKMSPGTTSVDAVDATDIVTVVKQEQLVYEWVPASIEAKQATIISSRILARIESVHVRAGDLVERGQVLIELEKADLQSKASQAQARIVSVSARLKEARQSLSRALDLTEKGLLARADGDQAKANHDALLGDLASAKQALTEAEATLNFASVRAPISGRVVDRFAEPGDTAQPGVQLLSLYNPLSLRVEANVREQLAITLNINQSIEVTVPVLNSTLASQVEELVPAGNAGSRSFLVKTRLEQSQGLLPGMYAQLSIPAGVKSLLLLPEERIARVGQLDVVWVLKGEVLERRFVRIGKTYPDKMVEIISGLEEGDQVLQVVR